MEEETCARRTLRTGYYFQTRCGWVKGSRSGLPRKEVHREILTCLPGRVGERFDGTVKQGRVPGTVV